MLTLVGTMHLDPAGPERLWRALDTLQPAEVAVEMDSSRARDCGRCDPRRNAQAYASLRDGLLGLSERIHPGTVDKYLRSLDYEYAVAKEFCRSAGKRLVLADPGFATDTIDQDTDAYLTSGLMELLELSPAEMEGFVAAMYALESYPVPQDFPIDIAQRDSGTVHVLDSLGDNAAYVCGLAHLKGEYDNLRSHFPLARVVQLDEF